MHSRIVSRSSTSLLDRISVIRFALSVKGNAGSSDHDVYATNIAVLQFKHAMTERRISGEPSPQARVYVGSKTEVSMKSYRLLAVFMLGLLGAVSLAHAADEPDLIFKRSTVFKWISP